ncbi:glycosyltransferase, partial [Candidatus Omnitrophota bacterium]
MLKNQNIICISSIDWDFIWQGHQEIMSSLAKNGNRVLFIENTGVRVPGIRDISRIKNRVKNWLRGIKGMREETPNLYIFSPLVLPFPYSRIARWINHHLILSILDRWTRVMDFSDPIIWTFLPTPLSLDIAESLVKKLAIYYCIDNFSSSSVSAKKVKRSEEKLLRKMDLVFVTSKGLYDHCSKYNEKVYNFPFAVNFNEFEKMRMKKNKPVPEDLANIKRPVIGYVGGVHKWLDQKLLKTLAKNHPEYSFVFVGPAQTDITLLKSVDLKNIYFLGNKDHKDVPLYIENFDACIIPYLIADYTKNVYPTKLNEYLAMGKPVISTALPEIIEFNRRYGEVVYVAEEEEKFSRYIKDAVSEKDIIKRDRYIEIARENSWKARIEKMSSLIEEEVEK